MMAMENTDMLGLIRSVHKMVSPCLFEGGGAEDISQVEIRALYTIAENRLCSMGELGADLVLTRSGVTRLVDRLEKKGFVRRHRSRDDGRVCCIDITESGLDKVERGLTLGRKLLQETLASLDSTVQQMIGMSFMMMERALRGYREGERETNKKLKKSTIKEVRECAAAPGECQPETEYPLTTGREEDLIIRPSRSGEADLIRGLLRKAELPVEDLDPSKIWNFKIAEAGDGNIAGTENVDGLFVSVETNKLTVCSDVHFVRKPFCQRLKA